MIKIIRSTFAAVLLVLLTACGADDSSDSPAAGGAEAKPRIALVMKSLANEFFVNMASGAEAHQADHSEQYELLVNGIRNESDLAQQVNLVDQMIGSSVQAIVIAPADSRALVPVLARAVAAGIVVINIDNRLEPEVLAEYDLQIPFIGPSNLEGAKLVGDYVLQDLTSDSEVAILEGISSAFNSIQRRTGFEQAVAQANMQVVTLQSGDWDQTKAAQLTSAILSQYPGLDVVPLSLTAAAALLGQYSPSHSGVPDPVTSTQ